ncbi:bifunctional proline dehydrogenase/L-glutamate gamma-semialdehyde dehydrogenase PutA [Aestuariispira insulae]|uniref:Bifunctional protein PutA n=1 Tax=Aestuariispira insulae TaxID=1461337 RepID=A0A3D9H587_9PROT|nr:bifunctional proline dehydrogenase/L-glutamate gamma-semialdehyde dehydrogenase PutA [Aestuariispira insulae]RED44675.1 L-proline dehydrogenase /delta-1-pyrroline-5-carboxylate dehydrogenase [Aestuariispira insulae]
MIFDQPLKEAGALRQKIRDAYRMDETECLKERLAQADLPAEQRDRIEAKARKLVTTVRKDRVKSSGIDAFMHEYELSSQEGVVLMCLAEALLRIPDADTADALIKDKIGGANWEQHLGHSESLFVNASTWALMLTGRVVNLNKQAEGGEWGGVLKRLVQRSGEPVIRQAVMKGMKILGRQFVMGRTINEALKRAKDKEALGYRYSYDMLGEAARTMEDAERYFEEYANAIHAIGKAANGRGCIEAPGVSVKLSALHPRYEFGQEERVRKELLPRLIELCQLAADYDIGLCIDAEEADRLDLSLDLIEAVAEHSSLKNWQGLGLAIQAYQKRCAPLIDWLTELARRTKRRLMVRLVKGAYWDTEIKRAQEMGLDGYPVFTRKVNTDVSYLACAKKLLSAPEAFYPCFATHNAHTLAAIMEMAGTNGAFEFQRLHGMGDALYDQVVGKEGKGYPVRIYAPVGSHEDLLAYLVRRLLENGANSSFVNRIVDESAPIREIIADPLAEAPRNMPSYHPRIPLPADLFGKNRRNAAGYDVTSPDELSPLKAEMEEEVAETFRACPLIGGAEMRGHESKILNPANHAEVVGIVQEADADQAVDALNRALKAKPHWDDKGADARADILNTAADLFEKQGPRLMALTMKEAGKTLNDAVAELREAVDFLRYYANRARADFAAPMPLPGPTGEENRISLHGRGVFLCISPWNFPLAIFTGQVAAALAAGNAVLAKPAEQTPLIAYEAVKILLQAGVPGEILHLLPGDGPTIGNALLSDPRLGGVAFTGSTETARLINRKLAERDGPIVPLIAETGGQNAMIVDSSALPEQVTRDVLISSFQSAGQRCSALRILFVQDDIADKLIEMIKGAMEELHVNDPQYLSSDIGPVIDADARDILVKHAERMDKEAKLLKAVAAPKNRPEGTYFEPRMYEIESLSQLQREVFGPILHVVRFKASQLDKVIEDINATGYGLTFAIHSRIEEKVAYICKNLHVGNAYVNRNQIGAIVGVQPFGGEGLSGTGPKAGGPRYLHRFAAERTISIDTTAAGGNASLMSLEA